MQPDNLPDASIALVRSEYFFPYIDLLRRTGTPIDRELRQARLPTLVEEQPDSYLSTDLVFHFIERCARREGIDDIGFEAGWKLAYRDFGPEIKTSLQQAPTLQSGIVTFAQLARLEDSELRCTLHTTGDIARIGVRQYIPDNFDSRIAEWQNLKAIVEVVRHYVHPNWLPDTLGIESQQPVSSRVRDRLGDTRILTGQPTTFLEFPAWMLTAKRPARIGSARDVEATTPETWAPYGEDLISRLGVTLVPYLASGHPRIEVAAEIVGISVRELQRQLHRMRTSYRSLIESLRYEQALRLLQNPDLNILDVALRLGYRDASNFARAIRRVSGSSPRELRQMRYMGD